jgi:hypothetical protein
MNNMQKRTFVTFLWALFPILVAYIDLAAPSYGHPRGLFAQQPMTQSDRERPGLPGFTVEVALSDKARQKPDSGESGIAGGIFVRTWSVWRD